MTAVADDVRVCAGCRTTKPLGFFGVTPWGLDSYCLGCRRGICKPRGQKPSWDAETAKRMCSGKKAYSKPLALAVAARCAAREAAMRVYKCPRCGKWHLTHRVT